MAFPVSPSNGDYTIVNGINYVYSDTTNSWTRVLSSMGNLTIAGNVNADKIYTIQGLYWAGNNAQVVGGGINMTTSSSPPDGPAVGDQWYATDIDVLFEYLDDGTSQQWVDITSSSIAANSVINLSAGDFSILGHITPGLNTTYDLGNVSYQWRDIYAGGVSTLSNVSSALGYFWSNGAPAFYSNTWTAQYLPNYTGNLTAGNANVNGKITTTSGLFWANGVSAIGPIYGNIQVAQYLPNYTGNATAGNIVATGNITSANLTTGNITVTGNVSILGNLAVTQAITSSGISTTSSVNVAYTPSATIGSALQLTGKDTQGGIGYFDFLRATNTTSGASNPNKTFRLNNTGGIEIINSAYSAQVMSVSDAGTMSVGSAYQIAGKKAVNGPAFSAYANNSLQTITSGSQQKVLFQVEEFDTDNCFASSTFTPTVEGYYQLNAEVRLDGSSSTGEIMIVLYRNTSEYKRGTNQSGTSIATNFFAMQVSALVYANGTTDYFEIKVQQTSGSSLTVTAVNNPAITWFNGAMVRGA